MKIKEKLQEMKLRRKLNRFKKAKGTKRDEYSREIIRELFPTMPEELVKQFPMSFDKYYNTFIAPLEHNGYSFDDASRAASELARIKVGYTL